jgi:enamine deaminase RidA (YjgF/YER057c/UK114 family)
MADTRERVKSGSAWEEKFAYSRAVADGRWVFVAGTTGVDYETMTVPDDVVEQTRLCLRNIANALAQCGATLNDVVRATYYFWPGNHMEAVAPVVREAFGRAQPAATGVIAQLIDPRLMIEIEVTALKPTGVDEVDFPAGKAKKDKPKKAAKKKRKKK